MKPLPRGNKLLTSSNNTNTYSNRASNSNNTYSNRNSNSNSSNTNNRRIGAKDCSPEINISEIIVDLQQWHSPMDFQWHFPTEFHLSMVFPEGLSLSQWIFTVIILWIVSGIFQWNFIWCDFLCNSLPRLPQMCGFRPIRCMS